MNVRLLVQANAREIPKEKGIACNDFKASKNWVLHYMRRSGFSLHQRVSILQKLLKICKEQLAVFERRVVKLRKNVDFQLRQIGSTDQTLVYLDTLLVLTVPKKGAKQVRLRWSGNENVQFTITLSCMAEVHKLSLYIVFTPKTLPENV